MNNYEDIKDGVKIIARKISGSGWRNGLDFYSNDTEFLQVGTWVYDEGVNLHRHKHNKFERSIDRTHEVLYVRKGSVKTSIYSETNSLVRELVLIESDILILFDCGHEYEILEDGTMVLEIKNGPYFGAEKDRERF